jgi:phage shock protein A
VEVDSASELARLAATVERLDADLQRLRHQAERLEARQQLALTLDQSGRW